MAICGQKDVGNREIGAGGEQECTEMGNFGSDKDLLSSIRDIADYSGQ